jgi:hypothetical protein
LMSLVTWWDNSNTHYKLLLGQLKLFIGTK